MVIFKLLCRVFKLYEEREAEKMDMGDNFFSGQMNYNEISCR